MLDLLGFPQPEGTPIYKDNTTCIKWSDGWVGGSDRAKHFDLRQHFVPEAVDKTILDKAPIDSAKGAADILTKRPKPLLRAPLWPLRKLLLGL